MIPGLVHWLPAMTERGIDDADDSVDDSDIGGAAARYPDTCCPGLGVRQPAARSRATISLLYQEHIDGLWRDTRASLQGSACSTCVISEGPPIHDPRGHQAFCRGAASG